MKPPKDTCEPERPAMSKRAMQALGIGTLVGVALCSCVNPAAEQALYAQTALIGVPKGKLLSCAGVPDRQLAAGGQEFYTYSSARLISYPGWGGYRGWPGYAADLSVIDCEATFTLRNDLVERVVYGGSSGGTTRLGQCYAIVQNCLPPMPPKPSASQNAPPG